MGEEAHEVENSFPLPEHKPIVPDKLAEFITTYLGGTTKIHVLVHAQVGWSKANGIILEGGNELSEVYSRVKMCADYHCGKSGGEAREYRTLMWRTLEDGRNQQRTLSFEVINESDDDGGGGGNSVSMETMRKQSDNRQAICSELRQMATMAIEFSNRSVDRVLEQARQDSERIKPLTALTIEMLSHHHEGLRIQATAVKRSGRYGCSSSLRRRVRRMISSGRSWRPRCRWRWRRRRRG